MFSIESKGKTELTARFDKMPSKLHDALFKSMTGLADDLKTHIANDKLNGQVLNRISGKLAGSIQRRMTDSPDKITATVYSNDTAKPYNRAHEYGAIIPDRFPKNAKALHWMVGGQHVFAKFARGFTLPARSYMRSGLADYKTQIINTLQKTVEAVAK